MRGNELRAVLKEAGAVLGGYAAGAFLLSLPALFAVIPGTEDTELSDSAASFVRGNSSSLEHSHTLFLGYLFAAYPPHMAFYPVSRLADRLFSSDRIIPLWDSSTSSSRGSGCTRPLSSFLAGILLITCGYFTARRGQMHILATAS